MDVPLLWTLRCYGTSLLQTPHYNWHPTIMDTPLLQTPHYYRYPTITDTLPLQTSHYYGHPAITDIPLLGTPHYAGHHVFSDTTLLRTEAIFPAETTKKSMEAILGTQISDFSYYRIADTSCGLKPIFLFLSPYNGQLGPTIWHNFSTVLICLLSITLAYVYYMMMDQKLYKWKETNLL